ncbi:uncharacterized protein LOC117581240 [Drosophila guanche]|uniref:uncharacterized protein LOC117581240 n=1 Tax=Drosophila guanche TaxID=7266 RepID=UPI0014711CD6|nr:uncharacterized protein LOC117581240 [Drosophila guanche]
MPYKRRAARPKMQSNSTLVQRSDAKSTDFSSGSQAAIDGVSSARKPFLSYRTCGRNRLFPLKKRSKAERRALATTRKHLDSNFKDEVEETAVESTHIHTAYWMHKYRHFFLILVLLNAIFFGYIFYLRPEDTADNRYEKKMLGAGMPLKKLFSVLRWLAGPDIF